MELMWPALLAALILPLSFLVLSHAKNRGKASRRLPPGPVVVPVLGNLLWVRHHGIDILRAMRRLHERYGPMLTLRMGSRLEVTVSDRRLAHAALVERGAALADRPGFASRDLLGLNAATISTSSYGPLWRLFRRNFVAEVANPARLRLFAPARAAVLAELTEKLRLRKEEGRGDQGTIVETFQYAMFRLLVAMCFGEQLEERAVRDIAAAQRDLLLYSSTKVRVFAFLPAVTTRIFRGRLQAMLAMRQRLKDMYMPLIEARRERKKLGAVPEPQDETTTLRHSYVDTLLDIRLNDDGGRSLSDEEMIALCSEFLNGGTDTTSTALQWIMAELVKNPAIQDKLHDEIEATIATTGLYHVSEEDVHKMPYLKAVVLEGLRRHPPGHMVLPHAPAEDMELGGYVIPKGTTVNFMVADMGMDEREWERPTEFAPERFLPGGDGDGVDITGTREIRMMPFGAGRRICPGLNVATLHLEYFVANLVRAFEWREQEGEEVDVDGEKAEFTIVMAKPLQARIVPRG
ncbi:Cytochrome P450 89A2 [Dichanthelium oligosanthes]|uniref:Cytochrome P450 89A2 n=1 Tax=Dichanthelium oligosanthes TaxID=888268 RepID=A0A1E5VAI5_9POAL|nr:Cytochrome P450 89A2 [Dichanthelium oligosanthes]